MSYELYSFQIELWLQTWLYSHNVCLFSRISCMMKTGTIAIPAVCVVFIINTVITPVFGKTKPVTVSLDAKWANTPLAAEARWVMAMLKFWAVCWNLYKSCIWNQWNDYIYRVYIVLLVLLCMNYMYMVCPVFVVDVCHCNNLSCWILPNKFQIYLVQW